MTSAGLPGTPGIQQGSRPRTQRRDERGGATTVVLTLAAVCVVVATVAAALGRLLVEQRHVAAAADLAALSAASALQLGGSPCTAAARTAEQNGATLIRCMVTGAEVEVATSLRSPALLGRSFDLTGEARAGPVR